MFLILKLCLQAGSCLHRHFLKENNKSLRQLSLREGEQKLLHIISLYSLIIQFNTKCRPYFKMLQNCRGQKWKAKLVTSEKLYVDVWLPFSWQAFTISSWCFKSHQTEGKKKESKLHTNPKVKTYKNKNLLSTLLFHSWERFLIWTRQQCTYQCTTLHFKECLSTEEGAFLFVLNRGISI